jgi:hypothetical protein
MKTPKESTSDRPIVGRRRLKRRLTNTPKEYRVGPGQPPREFQWKPGQSGNPNGAKPTSSIVSDLKALLERALKSKIKFESTEKKKILTHAEAGMCALVEAFATGDARARRDVFALAKILGVDLSAGQTKKIEDALTETHTADDEELLADYFRRHRDTIAALSRKAAKNKNVIDFRRLKASKPKVKERRP